MFEIEQKAWVRDRKTVIERLNSFAEYQCYLEKDDTYYKFPVEKDGKPVSIRIRKEKIKKNGTETFENLFTYKKKEIRLSEDGSSIEVNLENEFSFSDSEPFEMFIKDLNGDVSFRKTKITECWHYKTPFGVANIELCTVPPLGDFLEIEIVTEQENPEIIENIKKLQEELFIKSGISLTELEPRFYSVLIQNYDIMKKGD